jgi:hypothetical protein
MRRAINRIPVEIWREIFSLVFKTETSEDASSPSLIHILDTYPQHPCHNPLILPYILINTYLSPIIEELLFARVFLRASRIETFLVSATIRDGVGGIKSRGHYCRNLTIYDNNGESIDFSRLTMACPRLQCLRMDGFHGLSLKTDGKFRYRPPSDSIQALYLDIECLTWEHLQFVSLHFSRLRQLRVTKWCSTSLVNDGGHLVFPCLTHLSITEAFSVTVDPVYLHLPSLVHLGVEMPNPVGTVTLRRYLARHGKNLGTLDLRSPHTRPQYHFLYDYINLFLSHCPVVETLVLSYPKTYSSVEYHPSHQPVGGGFVHQSLHRIVIADFNRHSDLRCLQDISKHLSRETFPGIRRVSIILSPTQSIEISRWIMREAQRHFSSMEDGAFEFESLVLPSL